MDSPSPLPSNKTTNANSNKGNKKTTDTQLKGSIIEFMRERPFLWNSKHPSYKDYKRREHEFQLFSEQIDCSVQEIKRVWHVLRTNFFRAHKLLREKPQTGDGENGEKLWKYYLAMEYILNGTNLSSDTLNSLREDGQQTRSFRGTPKDIQRGAKSQRELNNNTKTGGGSSSHGSTNNSNITTNSSSLNNSSSSNNNKSTLLSDSSIDTDDENLYARSLTSTLKKFDPTTREIIKLKFQEIIVNYMQIQNQRKQDNDQDDQDEGQPKQENPTHQEPQDVL